MPRGLPNRSAWLQTSNALRVATAEFHGLDAVASLVLVAGDALGAAWPVSGEGAISKGVAIWDGPR